MALSHPFPDLLSLELLRSVAECGSIARAASVHGMSQPAASVRLRKLETVLGVRLLDRVPGGARLSSDAAAVVRWSEEVLQAMASLQTGARALQHDLRSHLRIAASMTVAEYLAPLWLARFTALDDALVVSMRMGNSEHVEELVRAREVDLGFVEGSKAPDGLRSKVVSEDELLVVVPPTHRWARRPGGVTAREVSATPLVLRESGSGTRSVLEGSIASLGLTVTPLAELGSTTAIKSAILSGLGPAVLSRLAVADDLLSGRLVAIVLSDLVMSRSIRATWSKEVELSPPAKLFLRVILD